jgi:hypothetical protein
MEICRRCPSEKIPKAENAKNIEQFRTISLLSVEGKIFFAILSRRLTEYLLKNDTVRRALEGGLRCR